VALISFTEGAALCGHRSRSQLYNMKADGRLEPYLRPGPKGRWWLESHPPAQEPLASYVLACTRLQANSPALALVERLEQLEQEPPAPSPPPLPWDGYCRVAGPEEPELSHEEFWANVAALFDAGTNNIFPPKMSWQAAHSTWAMMRECIETVEGGGRWDESVWLAASLNDATDNDERGWVESLLATGRLSAELEAQAREWLLSCEEPPPPM
jgi:hypothetical protein